jgi:hypothetical protein
MTTSPGAASHNSAHRRQASAQTAQLRPHSGEFLAIKSTPVPHSVTQSSRASIWFALSFSPPSARQCPSVMRHVVRHSVQASMQAFMFIAVLLLDRRQNHLSPFTIISDGPVLGAASETTQSEACFVLCGILLDQKCQFGGDSPDRRLENRRLLVAGFHVRCSQNVIKKRNWGRWQVDATIL